MNKEPKKTPNEYPHFSIRLSEEQKIYLNESIQEVKSSLNKKLNKEKERVWGKNDVVFEALILGLPLLKKQFSAKGKDR